VLNPREKYKSAVAPKMYKKMNYMTRSVGVTTGRSIKTKYKTNIKIKYMVYVVCLVT